MDVVFPAEDWGGGEILPTPKITFHFEVPHLKKSSKGFSNVSVICLTITHSLNLQPCTKQPASCHGDTKMKIVLSTKRFQSSKEDTHQQLVKSVRTYIHYYRLKKELFIRDKCCEFRLVE